MSRQSRRPRLLGALILLILLALLLPLGNLLTGFLPGGRSRAERTQEPESRDAPGSLRVTGLQSNFASAHSAIVQLNPALYAPGTIPLNGSLVPFAQTSIGGAIQALRFLVDGSITFSQAGSTAGAPVVGTVSGGVAEFVPVP